MIVCFNCSTATKLAMDSLIVRAEYQDYGELIACAVYNLALFHEKISETGSVILESGIAQAVLEVPLELSNTPATTSAKNSGCPPTVPNLFMMPSKGPESLPTAPPPDDIWSLGQSVPVDRWIFGQFNKLLPVKANCRALANLSSTRSDSMFIEDIANVLSEDALLLGDYLCEIDDKASLRRGDRFSTAFPTYPDTNSKARLRYVNQFLASKNKEGQLSGLLVDLKLINRTPHRECRLLLTEAGRDFAYLQSPVIDGLDGAASEGRLGDEERRFLLAHISANVPTEDSAYRTLLASITEGDDTPGRLDTKLVQGLSPERAAEIKDSFISTQRAGALSRMIDLGLVEREKRGIRVRYIVTKAGQEYYLNG